MPDRHLTPEELKRFVTESKTGKIFNALDTISEEHTKPSLHDLCILELNAKAGVHSNLIINQSADIRMLQATVARLRKELERFKKDSE